MYRSTKSYKYRRKSIYSSRHRHKSPIKVALMTLGFILGAAAIVFLGYSLEPLIQDFASGKYKPAASSSSVPTSASSVPSSKAGSSSTTSGAASTAVKGIYLPQSDLKDIAAADQTITAAKQAGINTAVVELKGDNGIVAYASKIPQAQGQGIIAAGAPDASTLASELTKNGITPAAKISCFKDPAAPLSMRQAAVLFAGDHSQMWLEYNGSSKLNWLNPYSSDAKQYVIDLAKEAVSLGYKQIYLDNVEFPVNDERAYYGDGLSSKEDALKAFVADASKQIEAAGGKVSFIMPGNASVGQGSAPKGQDQSIYAFTADYYSPNLCPSLMSMGVAINGAAVAKPDLTPGDTVTAAAAYLKTQAGDKLTSTVPFIQAYTNTGIGAGNYKQYTADDINAQITALKAAGISNFILYSPGGTYDLTGVNLK